MTLLNPYKFPSLKYFGNLIENISPRLYEQTLMCYTHIKDNIYKNSLIRKAKTFCLFEEISIETINRCNGSCSFCPVNRNLDTREYHLMEKELFYSIINQLHNMDYKKNVTLHCNNEPFLDKRIFEFAEYARNKLPQATIVLCTNGTLLTPEKFYRIIPSLDLLIIDHYDDKLQLNNNMKTINNICENDKLYKNRVRITLRKQNEILTSRSGQAKNRKSIKTLSSTCIYPFMHIAIRSDGKVNLCCNDALGQETLGDTNKEKLTEIWCGTKFKEVRDKLLINRNLLSLCKNCDTLVIPLKDDII